MSTQPGWPPNAEPPQPGTGPSDPQATQPLPPATGTYGQLPAGPSGHGGGYGQLPAGPSGHGGGYGQLPAGPSGHGGGYGQLPAGPSGHGGGYGQPPAGPSGHGGGYGQLPAGPSGHGGGYGQPPAGPSKKLIVGIIVGAVVGIVLASIFIPKLTQPKIPPVAMPSGHSFDLPSLPSANTKPNPGPASPKVQGGQNTQEGPVIKTIHPSELQTGDCPLFSDKANSSTKIRLVDCQGPHAIEVFAQVRIPEPVLPGNEAINKMAFQFCDKAFEEYIGIPHDKSLYGDYFYISPTEETWDAGDRTITCYVGGEGLVHQGLLKGIKK